MKEMMMKVRYKSPNGFTGTMFPDEFMGIKHYNLCIHDSKSGKLMYHATLEKQMTYEEVKEFVDAFPEFLEDLCRLSK